MQIDFSPEGIHLPELGLWLDPAQAREAAWLSHAHADHARGHHGLALGTPQTLSLYRERWPDSDKPRVLRELEIGESLPWKNARLTAYPSGHILGYAQLLIEYAGERLVYTGDIKLRPPLCGWTTQPVQCDRLIIESTFGLPVFHFLEREDAAARIVRFAQECLAEGEVPAFFGYPLGRGQEIVEVLCGAGMAPVVHGGIARYLPFYEAAGYAFPGWTPYSAKESARGPVVVTPGMRAHLEASRQRVRMAHVSGWAMFDSARTRTGADELIPYSDHGDFRELLALVEASGARRVEVVHGYADAFAEVLRTRGLEASSHLGVDAPATLAVEAEG